MEEQESRSSVSVVSGYGLDDRAIGVRSSAGAKDFSSSLFVQMALRPTQPPVQWVPGGPFPGAKRGRGVTLTTHPHLVPKSRMSRSYTPLPPTLPWHVMGLLCFANVEEYYHSPPSSAEVMNE
jgi:hypothetical protein